MGRFRFSIGSLMVIVAVVAVDLTMLRVFFGSASDFARGFFFALPMLNILRIGFVIGRRRQGRARAFWTSFTGFGCFTVTALVLDIVANRREVLNLYLKLLAPILRGFDSYLNSFGSEHWHWDSPGFWLVVVPFLVGISLPPLLLPALVGGWIVSRLSPNHVSDRDSCGVSGASRNPGDRGREGPLV